MVSRSIVKYLWSCFLGWGTTAQVY